MSFSYTISPWLASASRFSRVCKISFDYNIYDVNKTGINLYLRSLDVNIYSISSIKASDKERKLASVKYCMYIHSTKNSFDLRNTCVVEL